MLRQEDHFSLRAQDLAERVHKNPISMNQALYAHMNNKTIKKNPSQPVKAGYDGAHLSSQLLRNVNKRLEVLVNLGINVRPYSKHI
jgi:hypothetical protein